MKTLLLFLLLSVPSLAATFVGGTPFLNSSGAPSDCRLHMEPVVTSSFAPASIDYVIRHGLVSFSAESGMWSATLNCVGQGGNVFGSTYTVFIPTTQTTIQALIGGASVGGGGTSTGTSGQFTKAITSGMSSITVSAVEHGCGANPIWRVFDGSGWVAVDSNVSLTGDITLNWRGSFTGSVRVSCGLLSPNVSKSFSTSDTNIQITSSVSGFSNPYSFTQCFDASGNSVQLDVSVDLTTFTISILPNPTGMTPISGRCIAGA